MENQPKPRARFANLVLGNRKITFANFVDVFAQAMGDRTVFYLDRDLAFSDFGPRELTYVTLARLVRRLANSLEEMGVRHGDRVAVLSLNRVESVLCHWAAARLGAIPVPLNYMLRVPEVSYVMESADSSILLVDSVTLTQNLRGDPHAVKSAETVGLIDLPAEHAPAGTVALPDLVARASEASPPFRRTNDTDTVLIFYTSGTSGLPKGAALPEHAVMIGIRRLGALTSLFPAPRHSLAVLVMPVAHTGGFTQMMMSYAMGIPMQFVSKFDPATVLDLIEERRATHFTGAPVMYRMLEEAGAADRDLSSIKVWGGGADAFDDDLVRRFRGYGRRKAFGLLPLFIRGYGMAETNSWCAMSPPFPAGERCVGWSLPSVSTRIVDPDTGEKVPRGEPGELWISGKSVMSEYWGEPDKTAEAFTDHWYRTGDIMRRGKWRMLFFEDRSSDLIKAGGYKVASSEVETVMAEHPAIDRAVVVGLPHEIKGQVPVAAVTLQPDADFDEASVLEWLRARLAPYKCPRRIFVLDDLPLTFSLKPKKAEIRKLLAQSADL